MTNEMIIQIAMEQSAIDSNSVKMLSRYRKKMLMHEDT